MLPFHLPDERLLLSGQASTASSTTASAAAPHAASTRPSSFITGSIKHPDKDSFVPASSAVPAPAPADDAAGHDAASSSKKGRHRGSQVHRRRHHRNKGAHLTVRMLRRMLVVAGPAGHAVRRNAALMAAGHQLGVSLCVVVLGSLLGWATGAKAAAKARRQQEEEEAVAAEQQLLQEQQLQQKWSKGWFIHSFIVTPVAPVGWWQHREPAVTAAAVV